MPTARRCTQTWVVEYNDYGFPDAQAIEDIIMDGIGTAADFRILEVAEADG